MRPLICNYKLHSIKHVCHTDFSARIGCPRARGKTYTCVSVCRRDIDRVREREREREKGREASNQFALWLQLLIFDTSKDFINCHLLSALKKKVLRCLSDFGNLFWPFPLPTHTHTQTHFHTHTQSHSHTDTVTCVFCSHLDCAYHVQL